MAQITHDCPHCDAKRSAMPVVGQGYGRRENYFFCICPTCAKPIVFELATPTNDQIGPVSQDPFFTPERYDLALVDFWPKPPAPNLPDALPAQVARAFMQAEDNFHRNGMEEAAAAAYGRALDIGTKMIAAKEPDAARYEKKMIAQRLDMLADSHRIPPDLRDWARHIQTVRNGAMHDVQDMPRSELEALRALTEMVLRYLFTLPEMVAERKAATVAGLTKPPPGAPAT